jgi:serine/threonine protein kinase/tetratricopeptide (TPR) repeat protein
MSTPPSLADLVSRWHQLRQEGHTVSLQALCRDCPGQEAQVQAHLEAVASMLSFLGVGPDGETEPSIPGTDGVPPRRPALTEIPGYEILGELGRGGMGVVYLACQLGLKRLVGLKVILAGPHADPAQLARFKAEAEAVARLRHPNIVQIYEVGEHAGLPFFSVEYMDGGSLDRQLHGTPLPPRQAAALLETLARAMAVAHQHGVIHRDLKPANILLQRKSEIQNPKSEEPIPQSNTAASDFGFRISDFEPKVTDFGLAKCQDAAGHTQAGALLGTPSYMAPEQAAGRAPAVSTATDVYGLGAILYELLTGRPPFKAATILDTLEQVRTQEPVPPSRLQPAVPRDLETVCLRCLHKDPARRYAGAAALADDLRRFLEDRPVLARPVGQAERLWRWCRRNPLVAGLSALLVLVLAGALAGLTLLWLRADAAAGAAAAEGRRARGHAEAARLQQATAEEQSRLARAEAAKAGKIAQMLTSMFEANDPLALSSAPLLVLRTGETLTAKEILDRGAERVSADLKEEPDVRAQVMNTLGGVYCTLGLPEKAGPLLEEALALRRKLLPPDHPELASSLHNLGWLHHLRGDYPEAERLYREALAIQRRQEPPIPQTIGTTLFTLAWLLSDQEDYDAAAKTFQEVIALRRQHLGEHHRDVAAAQAGLAAVYIAAGKVREAVAPSFQALETLRQVGENRGLAEAILLFQQGLLARELPPLGGSLLGVGGPAQAERHFRRCLDLTRKILGDRHPYTAMVLHELARALERRGRDAEAEQCYRECLAVARPYGLDHPKVQIAVASFTDLLRRQAKRPEAEHLVRDTLGACRRRYGPEHPLVANVLLMQAGLLDRPTEQGQRERLLREALAIYRRAPGPPRRNLTVCLHRLALCLGSARAAEAERLLDEAVPLSCKQLGAGHPLVARLRAQRAWYRLDQGKTAGVEAELRQALDILRKSAAGDSAPARFAWRGLGRLYRNTGRPAEAATAALECRKISAGDARALYEAACELLLCAALPGVEAAQRRQYEDQALETLRQAQARGFTDLGRLRSDAVLAPLRGRPEFRAMLMQIEAQLRPAKPGPGGATFRSLFQARPREGAWPWEP